MTYLKKTVAMDLRAQALKAAEYAPMTESQQLALESGLGEIVDEAIRVALMQKELSMPVGSFEVVGMLRYSRQPSGHDVLPSHALNAITRAFLTELYDVGFHVTQFYVGEESAIFSPQGAQRLRLHW